jgi:hypothetical protein
MSFPLLFGNETFVPETPAGATGGKRRGRRGRKPSNRLPPSSPSSEDKENSLLVIDANVTNPNQKPKEKADVLVVELPEPAVAGKKRKRSLSGEPEAAPATASMATAAAPQPSSQRPESQLFFLEKSRESFLVPVVEVVEEVDQFPQVRLLKAPEFLSLVQILTGNAHLFGNLSKEHLQATRQKLGSLMLEIDSHLKEPPR